MNIKGKKKSDVVSHIWFAMAVFLLVFNSTPVKKYIRLHLWHTSRIELTAGEHLAVRNYGDCTLMERHQFNCRVTNNTMQSSDSDNLLYFAALIGTAILFFLQRNVATAGYTQQHENTGRLVPIYLRICKLQV